VGATNDRAAYNFLMDGGVERGLTSRVDFERFLTEELSLAVEFDLPLTVVAARLEGGWNGESVRDALGVLRVADLTTLADPEHLVAFLPNTGAGGAGAVERRIEEILPEAEIGFASHLPGDTAPEMIERALEDSGA
jgi:hypothetical protein